MKSGASGSRRRKHVHVDPPRAVIDIGSNTVRLVIYEGSRRAPQVVWNEKRTARLGRDLAKSGEIPEEAATEGLEALGRFAIILGDLGIEDVRVVATAATRDASNGAEFLRQAAALGLPVEQISGEEEARLSALGTIGAFPDALGVVADLGGGSLELVSIGDNAAQDAVSLPLGTLRLPALGDGKDFARAVHRLMAAAGWAAPHPGKLYLVGGTWRAFAAYAMHKAGYPVSDPHGFTLTTDEARALADKLADANPAKLEGVDGISAMRAAGLPDAARLMLCLLDELQPDGLVFSSWGLREGTLFEQLDPVERSRDPLLAGIDAFASARAAPITEAALLAAWTADLAGGSEEGDERLRLASAQLSIALHRTEPNLRLQQAREWSLAKRWLDLDARGRALICAALYGSLGKGEYPPELTGIATSEDLDRALTWGLAYRLAQRLGAASRVSLSTSSLQLKKKNLVLRLDPSRAALATFPVTRELEALAARVGRAAKIKIGKVEALFEPAED